MNNEEIPCNVSIILYPSYKMMKRGRGGRRGGYGEREREIIKRRKYGSYLWRRVRRELESGFK